MIRDIFLWFLIWRVKHLPNNVFLILVSILIGLIAGLAAVVLKTGVHYIQNFLHSSFEDYRYTYFFLIYPTIGLLLSTLFVQRVLKGRLHRGVGNVLLEITRNKGKVAKHKLYSQLISSLLTLGFGGSAGLEAPISVTGAAIGSRLSMGFRLGESERKLLLGCGAAGGISAIFNSPIAGVLFAIEILLLEVSIPAFVPLLISSASATVISKVLYSGQPFKLITEEWQLSSIPYYIVLGIICGAISVYVIKVYSLFGRKFFKKTNPYLRAVIGGLSLGGLIFFLPPLFGEGYFIVDAMLNGNYLTMLNDSLFWSQKTDIWFIIGFAFVSLMMKVVATGITVNSGGNGGMFGSSLVMGSLLGFVFSRIINLSSLHSVTEINFVALGMAGILAGTVQAPLTAIFLIAEITGGYALFIPLMIVVSLSYFITRYFEPNSVYTKDIVESGDFSKYDRDRMVLENLLISRVIESDFIAVKEKDTLRKLVEAISHTKRNIFPVTDEGENLKGVVMLDDIREVMFNQRTYDLILVNDIMRQPPSVVDVTDKMYDIVKKFDELNVWNLPVVRNGKYIGFISKAAILNHYRDLLKQLSKSY